MTPPLLPILPTKNAKGAAVHIKALDAVVASVRRRVDQGDCPVEPVQGVEILEGAVVQLADRLDGLEWDGCLTGDCPHQTGAECDKHLADELRRVFGVSSGAASPHEHGCVHDELPHDTCLCECGATSPNSMAEADWSRVHV